MHIFNPQDITKGVKDAEVLLDGECIWRGCLQKGCGNNVFDYSTVLSLKVSWCRYRPRFLLSLSLFFARRVGEDSGVSLSDHLFRSHPSYWLLCSDTQGAAGEEDSSSAGSGAAHTNEVSRLLDSFQESQSSVRKRGLFYHVPWMSPFHGACEGASS